MARKKTRRRANSGISYGDFHRPYVPVGVRRRKASKLAQEGRAKGRVYTPVSASGRAIASTPWGQAWCDHIESFRDYENRLPRGRTYLRNGSVIHLEVAMGRIDALVMGSELYEQKVTLKPCQDSVWRTLCTSCKGGIGSLVELLEGRLSSEVMGRMTAPAGGLLPDLRQVKMSCSCPDWASLCKHLAAVLYGMGARLDERPELLFTLRGVDPSELVGGVVAEVLRGTATSTTQHAGRTLEGNLGDIFGIELEHEPAPAKSSKPKPSRSRAREPERSEPQAHPSRRSASAGAKKTAAKPRRRSLPEISRQDLLILGVPAGTISTWLHQAVLLPTAARGVYRHTLESLDRLSRR